MDESDSIRRELQAGLTAAGLNPTTVSLQLGRSKDYIGDFLRGNKRTLGHAEITEIRKLIGEAVSVGCEDGQKDSPAPNDSAGIHIELAAFREALFATLRTLNVPPVLARSRIDDLLSDLRSLSAARPDPTKAETIRIDAGSEAPGGGGPSGRPSGR